MYVKVLNTKKISVMKFVPYIVFYGMMTEFIHANHKWLTTLKCLPVYAYDINFQNTSN